MLRCIILLWNSMYCIDISNLHSLRISLPCWCFERETSNTRIEREKKRAIVFFLYWYPYCQSNHMNDCIIAKFIATLFTCACIYVYVFLCSCHFCSICIKRKFQLILTILLIGIKCFFGVGNTTVYHFSPISSMSIINLLSYF